MSSKDNYIFFRMWQKRVARNGTTFVKLMMLRLCLVIKRVKMDFFSIQTPVIHTNTVLTKDAAPAEWLHVNLFLVNH